MIRESYGSTSSDSNIDLSNYVTKSDLNSSVVNVIKNLDDTNYKESEGLTTTIHDETINNLSTAYDSTQYTNMTNLNNWVENKIVSGSTNIYNKIKSELFTKKLNHKPINNINFNLSASDSKSISKMNLSFNTNNLVFSEIKLVGKTDAIKVNSGDIIVVFFKHYLSNVSDYVVDCVLFVWCGFNISSNTTVSHLADQTEYTYFRCNPWKDNYSSLSSSIYSNDLTISTNAECMLTTKFTNTVPCPFDNTEVNYYYLWSSENEYIDFTNVFMTNSTNELIFKDKAAVGTVYITSENMSDQSFYALKQRNSIQNEMINMLNDTNMLNDLRLIASLYQAYSLSSIRSTDYSYSFVLTPDNTAQKRNINYKPTSTSVYIAFFTDLSRNIVMIDLVYCPGNVIIGSPSNTISSSFESYTMFTQCNNIFTIYNDLIIQCSGCINLNRNISFIINFMNLRNSENATHLLIKSNRCSFSNIINKVTEFTTPDISMIDINNLKNYCYLLDLDDWIDNKQGCIMNTNCGDSIRITF